MPIDGPAKYIPKLASTLYLNQIVQTLACNGQRVELVNANAHLTGTVRDHNYYIHRWLFTRCIDRPCRTDEEWYGHSILLDASFVEVVYPSALLQHWS